MKKILVCCANGAGTSLMIKMTVEKACKKVGFEAKVTHAPISEGKGTARNYDIVITTSNFSKMFDSAKDHGTIVIPLLNPMSQDEVIKHFKENGLV